MSHPEETRLGDGFLLAQPLSDETIHKARLAVCAAADHAGDATTMLAMLGILPGDNQ
ncbi:hypothetical protein [Rhodococcus sp. (in: high G+C Gram-positive bacteria)]|uniref:hypothetical protein n=1 Tax=Rhodococcus sp. TaxID=1831 RepID=UPI00257EF8E1|nr:hypothetical protein [Rhodococcus sp. (in: high G+C Gram-positive bacteria)]MBQ7808139.1 hypothetical protein [Rhodococcus sp. (in: high G+C Gram-positive bacteria)]